MSNKNNNSAKQKRLAEKHRLEKKKMLLQMKKELETLEYELKHSKLVNLKISTVKNLKISLRFMQRIAPYVLTAVIMAGGCKLVGGGIPFYSGDTFKINSNTMKEFDSLGNIRYEQQYDDYDNSSNILYYYSQWQQGNDGFYSRNVETYKLDELTEEEILKLFAKEDLNLSDVFGDPTSKKRETKNNVTEEEIQQKDYLQAIIYNEDENDYIIHKETIGENIAVTVIYLLLTALAELIPLFIRSEISSFDFDDCVREIKRKYPSVNQEELAKKLEIKRSNYDRLTR